MKILIKPFHAQAIKIPAKNASDLVPDFKASGPVDVLAVPNDEYPEIVGYTRLSSKKMDEIYESEKVKYGRNIIESSISHGTYLSCSLNRKIIPDWKIIFYNNTQENIILELNGWDFIYKEVEKEEPEVEKEVTKKSKFWDTCKLWISTSVRFCFGHSKP